MWCMNANPIDYKTPNSLAAIWSMMLPGLGQMMKNQFMPGLLWAVFTGAGYYAFFWPGVTFHALCILDAAFYKGEGSFLQLESWKERVLFLTLVAGLIGYVYFRNF